MSSIPGYTLESFILWQYDLIVESQPDANFSLSLAEVLGTSSRRLIVTDEVFKEILEPFEPHREQVERLMFDFDEDTQSWRDYGGSCFDFLPDLYPLIVQHAKESNMSSRQLLKVMYCHQRIQDLADKLNLGFDSDFTTRLHQFPDKDFHLCLGFPELSDYGLFEREIQISSSEYNNALVASLEESIRQMQKELDDRKAKAEAEDAVVAKLKATMNEEELKILKDAKWKL